MTILLIRHGETALNRARVIQPPETPLNAFGQAQARAFADRIHGEGPRPVAIVASDMPRASETAAILAARLDLPVRHSPLLRERFFGDWSGKHHTAFDFDPIHDDRPPPNGETVAQFNERVQQAADWIEEQRANTDGLLAVVTHGLVIRGLLASARLEADPEADMATVMRETVLRNTCMTVISAQRPWTVSLLACHTHLAGLADPDPEQGPLGQY